MYLKPFPRLRVCRCTEHPLYNLNTPTKLHRISLLGHYNVIRPFAQTKHSTPQTVTHKLTHFPFCDRRKTKSILIKQTHCTIYKRPFTCFAHSFTWQRRFNGLKPQILKTILVSSPCKLQKQEIVKEVMSWAYMFYICSYFI